MNSLAETIKNELKNMKDNNSSVETTTGLVHGPTKQECAAIPCAYLGVMDNCETEAYLMRPKNAECSAIPCAMHDDVYTKPKKAECSAIPCAIHDDD